MREAPLGRLVTYMHITPRDDCPIRKVMYFVVAISLPLFGRSLTERDRELAAAVTRLALGRQRDTCSQHI